MENMSELKALLENERTEYLKKKDEYEKRNDKTDVETLIMPFNDPAYIGNFYRDANSDEKILKAMVQQARAENYALQFALDNYDDCQLFKKEYNRFGELKAFFEPNITRLAVSLVGALTTGFVVFMACVYAVGDSLNGTTYAQGAIAGCALSAIFGLSAIVARFAYKAFRRTFDAIRRKLYLRKGNHFIERRQAYIEEQLSKEGI